MNNQHCIYRDHVIQAVVMEHPGIPTPWAAGCQITLADGHSTRRIPLPLRFAFLADPDFFARATTDGHFIRWDDKVEISLTELFQLAQK